MLAYKAVYLNHELLARVQFNRKGKEGTRHLVTEALGYVLFSFERENHTRYMTDVRGLSSAGRAPALHAGGQRFDPARLHKTGY